MGPDASMQGPEFKENRENENREIKIYRVYYWLLQ